MQDRTTDEPWRTRDREPSAPSLASLLENRPRERYVPADVSCANCGVGGSEFGWFQRIPAGDVDGERPARDRQFCSVVCVGQYVARFDGYDPDLGPVGVVYD